MLAISSVYFLFSWFPFIGFHSEEQRLSMVFVKKYVYYFLQNSNSLRRKNGSLNGFKLHEIISELHHNSELYIKKWLL